MESSTSNAGALPLLALIGSGDRRYREYILASLHGHFRVWLFDTVEPTWHLPYLTGFTHTDTRDSQALVDAVNGVTARQEPFVGLFSYDEWLIDVTAVAAEQLGLPTSPPHAVAACRDKAATRTRLSGSGIPQPRSIAVAGPAEAVAAADRIGYPVVVKARRLAGSIGVQRADDERALEQAYRAAAAATFPSVARDGTDVLIEEYLDGPEISIDCAVSRGDVVPLVLARKQTGLDPYFEETGHVVDAADPLLTDEGLLDQLRRIHAGIGITQGMTHVEFRLTHQGPRLVEINARLGGDFIPLLGHLATGVDLAVVAGQVAVGQQPVARASHSQVAGIRFLYPPVDCQVVNAQVHRERFTSLTRAAVATATPGQKMALPPRGFLSRYGYVIATGATVDEVDEELRRAPEIIELQYEPLEVSSGQPG